VQHTTETSVLAALTALHLVSDTFFLEFAVLQAGVDLLSGLLTATNSMNIFFLPIH
jgi:hypothetical protein